MQNHNLSMSQFERHYKDYFDKVYRFVFWRTGTRRETAEDLCGEIWIKALSAYPKFEKDKSFAPWIMTIAKNHVLNFYRTRGREVLESELPQGEEYEVNIFENLARRREEPHADKQDLYAALAKLGDRDREILELKHIQGFSHKEIGEMREESEGAIKVAAHRAIKKLKELL